MSERIHGFKHSDTSTHTDFTKRKVISARENRSSAVLEVPKDRNANARMMEPFTLERSTIPAEIESCQRRPHLSR